MAIIARMTRSSMLDVMSKDYIRTARAKGLSHAAVVFRHALKNAFLPIITVIGLNFGLLLGGAVLTETIFSWPGLGRYVVDSLLARDYPAVQGCILFFAVIMVLVNLTVDILYFYVDPRLRIGGKG
jgi:peptide/nickel transport system permease protein